MSPEGATAQVSPLDQRVIIDRIRSITYIPTWT